MDHDRSRGFRGLVRREHTVLDSVERFRAFDAIVTWAGLHDEALLGSTWDFVLDHATGTDRLAAGIAANQADETTIARDAFARVADSDDSANAPRAAFALGVVLKEQGEIDAAKAAYQRAIDSHHQDAAPRASFNLGVLLEEQGKLDAAKAAYARRSTPTTPMLVNSPRLDLLP